jgi:hypothetical protein
MSRRDLVCQAIKDCRVIEFLYKGQLRTVEPYVVYPHYDRKSRVTTWKFEGYSIGYSESGTEPSWRAYTIDEMTDLTIRHETFRASCTCYEPNATRYREACCKLLN